MVFLLNSRDASLLCYHQLLILKWDFQAWQRIVKRFGAWDLGTAAVLTTVMVPVASLPGSFHTPTPLPQSPPGTITPTSLHRRLSCRQFVSCLTPQDSVEKPGISQGQPHDPKAGIPESHVILGIALQTWRHSSSRHTFRNWVWINISEGLPS